jgi:uncharacterized protein (DUF433 family)
MAMQQILEATVRENPITEMDGALRIAGTRLLLDLVIHGHKQGWTPEQILEAYPSSVDVSDIYAAILVYLDNKELVEGYLAERTRVAEQVEAEVREKYSHPDLRDRLLKRMRKGA